jgi:Fe-S-cluster containining protein
VISGRELLRFRCTGCGNCCKDPLLPLTDADLRRILRGTGERARDVVRFVISRVIDMDDEPQAFVRLRQGKRVMVLAQAGRSCRFLDSDNRCTIYAFRPVGCRVFPFDAQFSRSGALRRLELIQATDCHYELDGTNRVQTLRETRRLHDANKAAYHERVAEWNRRQAARLRTRLRAQSALEYLEFLGLEATRARANRQRLRKYQLLQP